MSMHGAQRSALDAAVREPAHRAHRLRLAGRLEQACECACSAAHAARIAVDAGTQRALPAWAEAVALECGIAIERGRFDNLLTRLDAAQSELGDTGLDENPAVQLAAARLHLEAARLHAMQQRLSPAREHFLRALAAPDRATLEGEPGGCVRIRALGGLGAVLCMHGEYGDGLQRLEQALAESNDGPLLEAARHDRARILINLGAAHFEQHRLEEAGRRIEQAQATLQPLLRARRAGARADLGRAGINLGGIHSRAGRIDAAVQAYREAIDALDRAARTQGRGGDALRLKATRAKASMNLGYTLFEGGEFDGAERYLAAALRRYAPLLQSRPQLRADLARTRVNAARLAQGRGQAERAATLYAQALQDFEAMMQGDAAPHLAGDAANARLGVARAALLRGQARRSARLFSEAMTTLRELTRGGALHHTHAWLRSWVEQASLLVEGAPEQGEAAREALLKVMREPPLRALGEHEEPLRGLSAALDALLRWNTSAHAAARALAAAALRHLLDATAQILADSSPAWLAAHETAMRAWVERLGKAVLSLPDAPRLAAQWFLCTRGLRAQRAALAAGTEPRLAALRGRLDELTRVESELLGAARAAPSLEAPAASAATAPHMAATWQALRDEVSRGLHSAVRDGLLPPLLHLGTQEVQQGLAPRQAVLFVARLDRTQLMAVALAAGTPARQWQVSPPRGAEVPCDLLNAAARQALRHDFGALAWRDRSMPVLRPLDLGAAGEPSAGDRLALAALRRVAQAVVAPALRELNASGARDIAIVPADDLHLLPWGDLLRGWMSPTLSLAVYPNAGAWWRCRERSAAHGAASALPRWGMVCARGPADAAQLQWVEVEQRLSRRLWHDDGVEPDARQAPDTLLVMGHGELPRGNPSLAGLRLDDGRVLGARDVAAGGAVERVLLSSCMLGRTDEAFGEPLGFLSTCFAYRARFGVGWLTEVPDEAACLFSLALQFTLRRELSRCAAAAAWSRAFHGTCAGIERGRWPEGFSAWLGAEPSGASPLQCPAAPPPALQRVLPWVLALGE